WIERSRFRCWGKCLVGGDVARGWWAGVWGPSVIPWGERTRSAVIWSASAEASPHTRAVDMDEAMRSQGDLRRGGNGGLDGLQTS
ncbi:hypothetical protein, partial [Rhodococcus erythropolis]|uniref:hypothetical protein n=1 Tax=Rhodococcus erythropolis TaxID=1833 RepID=UPI001C404DFE